MKKSPQCLPQLQKSSNLQLLELSHHTQSNSESSVGTDSLIKVDCSMTPHDSNDWTGKTLFQIADELAELPTPRQRFFEFVVSASGLSPNTVRMNLCSKRSGKYPRFSTRVKISQAIGKPVEILFPEDRLQEGSLVWQYLDKSNKHIEYLQFIERLRVSTTREESTVRGWLSKKRVPEPNRKSIAAALGLSIETLFKNTPL